jgi:maltooligosyltrehalose trehalohydrolase
VRKGRRDEFVKFPEFAAPEARDRIPDPNAPDTFERSRLDWSVVLKPSHMEWLTFYRKLLALRAGTIVPRLTGEGSTGQYRVLAVRALEVVWTLPDHSRLLLLANYDDHELQVSQPQPALLSEALFATHQLRRITSQSYTLPSHFVGLYLTTGTTS